jgi:hypothetical protein
MRRTIYIFSLIIAVSILQGQQLVEIFQDAADLDTGSVLWIDYNGDGDQDLLLSGLTDVGNETFLYANDGDGEFEIVENSGLPQLGLSVMEKADYDGDGDMDLIVIGNLPDATTITEVYINNGDGTFSIDSNNSFTAVYLGSCNWIDYDNDDDLDIFISGFDNSQYITELYANDGAGNFSIVNGTGLPGVSYSDSDWADYDGDGYQDLFLCGMGWSGAPDIANLYKNNGDGTFTETFSFTSVWLARAEWNDFDNDGDPDIIFSGYNTNSTTRPTTLMKNDNGEFISVAENLINVSQPAIAWGDYDMDGDDDLFIAGAQEVAAGQIMAKLYTNDGDESFEDSNFFFTGVWWADAAWGDIDGDSDLDLVYIGKDDGGIKHTFVYRNDVINSTNTHLSEQDISIYPNPSSDFINLNIFNSSFEKVKIIDITGKVVWEKDNFRSNYIDIQNINTGIYFLQLNKNGESKSIRFVKK